MKGSIVVETKASTREIPLRVGEPGHAEHSASHDVQPQLNRTVVRRGLNRLLHVFVEDRDRGGVLRLLRLGEFAQSLRGFE